MTGTAIEAALGQTRERTLELLQGIGDEDLERVHCTLMSPLVWDLGHIAAFEDLWAVHRLAGKPLLREDLVEVYDAFETPRARRGNLPFLRAEEARRYLHEIRERTLQVIRERGADEIHELVIRHEQQHNETMLQTIALAQLDGSRTSGHSGRPSTPSTGLELIEIPSGECTIGAPDSGFAYDNERPRHHTDVRGYLIARTPVSNASYLTFVEGGGYERREWWSDEGWAWKEEYDISRPHRWSDGLDPDAPVVHVSWFEADAFARAHGARLPTEAEWEKAATWDQETGNARRYPWGSEAPVPGVHANVDQLGGRPLPAGSHPQGASPHGCLAMIGDVWEWTASPFGGYPGFAPYPYREYSEVFFGDEYRVLRGGSWATRAHVITPTFRNWDYPQRRQIFSGFRIARDL